MPLGVTPTLAGARGSEFTELRRVWRRHVVCIAHRTLRRGVTVMVGAAKFFSVVVVLLVPGGLLVAMAFVLARLVSHQMQLEQGPHRQRLARAVASVRWRDVVREARRSL